MQQRPGGARLQVDRDDDDAAKRVEGSVESGTLGDGEHSAENPEALANDTVSPQSIPVP